MFALTLSKYLEKKGIHYSWVIAAVTFLSMLATAAALGLPGAMLKPLSTEFGWSTEQLSAVFAIRFALFGLLGPFAAVFIGRFGLRKVMLAATVFITSSFLLATQVTALWQLFVLLGLLLGCGTGLTALVMGTIVATRWFNARRGLVVGLLAASTATGQLIFLPIAAWLIQHVGWRYAVMPVVIACAVVALLVALLMKNQPGELGLSAYGDTAPPSPVVVAGSVRVSFLQPLTVLPELARSQTFWILAGTFFICGLSTNGLVQTHFISLCGDNGLSPVPAASVLSMMGFFDLFGTTMSGYLSDRYDNRKLLFWYYGLRGVSLFILPYSSFTLYGLSLFAMFYGLDWIATVPPTARLVAQRFGKERAGLIFGWVFAAHQLGSATAAYGAGLTRTLLLTYTPALLAAGAACIVAAIAVMMISRTPKLAVA